MGERPFDWRTRAGARSPDASLSIVALLAAWVVLSAAALAVPRLGGWSDPGDAATRNTARVALGWYAAAATLMLLLRPDEWQIATKRGARARWCWTLGWAAYVVHVAAAFHYHHGWSHGRAFEHVRSVSGVGEGVFVSYLFTLLWTVDVAWWWVRPSGYAARPVWVDRSLHGFMAFVVFNATVVYESGPVRWAGAALAEELARLWVLRTACRGGRGDAN